MFFKVLKREAGMMDATTRKPGLSNERGQPRYAVTGPRENHLRARCEMQGGYWCCNRAENIEESLMPVVDQPRRTTQNRVMARFREERPK